MINEMLENLENLIKYLVSPYLCFPFEVFSEFRNKRKKNSRYFFINLLHPTAVSFINYNILTEIFFINGTIFLLFDNEIRIIN